MTQQVVRNVYLVGMTGVGKTTVGKILSNKLKWAFVDVNETIEAIYGQTQKEIFSNFGEDSFRNMELTVLQELSQGEHQVFACNCDTVLEERKLRILKQSGITVWLDAPFQDLMQRIQKMDKPGLPAGETSQTVEEMAKSRKDYYKQADIHVATHDSPPEATADKLLQVLRQLE